MKLSDTTCRQAKPQQKAYKLVDGGGLFLYVTPTGSRLWRWKYRHDGKEKLMSFGAYPKVTLAEARERHKQEKAALVMGADPMTERKAKKQADRQSREIIFRAVAHEWRESQKSGWSDVHYERVCSLFAKHIEPDIGDKPIADLTPMDVLNTIRKMEAKGLGESCYKALAHIGKVCMYAVVSGRASINPVAGLNEFLKPKPPVKHHRHMKVEDIGQFLRLIDVYGGLPQTRIATKLIMLCFMRSGELRQAAWDEVDFEKATWTIPSSHRKGSKTLKASGIPHVIPLSRQALALLEELREHTGGRSLVFEGQKRGKPISENTINKALDAIGYGDEQSAHGFRGLASTILNEHGFNRDAIERQLSHKEHNQVRRAYDHSERMAERIEMMQWWADYLDALRVENVVPLMAAKRA